MDKIKAHILNTQTNTLLAIPWLSRVPRVGDEVRLDEDQFFTVTRVVWCLDEPEYIGGRVNLGVVPVEGVDKEETLDGLLIKAAPEMYEALKLFASFGDNKNYKKLADTSKAVLRRCGLEEV